MPTGVLMPVASMSMRVLIGIVQALFRPGIWTAAFMRVDQFVGRAAAVGDDVALAVLDIHGGPLLLGFEHDGRLDHVERRGIGGGLGAADLAEDVCTSGKVLMIWSVCWSTSRAFVGEMPGKVVGM